ncbi:MAG: LptF/LptG family permease [Dongiaceae bacterium]
MAATAISSRILPPTFSLYLARLFLKWLLGTMALIVVIVLVADLFQFLTDEGIGKNVWRVLVIALLKLPQTAQQAIPFAILVAGLGTYRQLTQSSELIVARASGLSVWQFLLPVLVAAFLVGVFRVTALDPFATTLMARYETMRSIYFEGTDGLSVSISGGVWLREQDEKGTSIVHAFGVDAATGTLTRVTILQLDRNDQFEIRYDALAGRLRAGHWELEEVRQVEAGRGAVRLDRLELPTRLAFSQIVDRFAKTNSISFWELPAYAANLEATGFSGRPHKLLWHRLLAMPFLYLALILIAAAFALRLYRKGDGVMLVGAGALTGFLLYFFSDLVYALGINSSIPLELAAWAPAGVVGLLGIALLLHLEDG